MRFGGGREGVWFFFRSRFCRVVGGWVSRLPGRGVHFSAGSHGDPRSCDSKWGTQPGCSPQAPGPEKCTKKRGRTVMGSCFAAFSMALKFKLDECVQVGDVMKRFDVTFRNYLSWLFHPPRGAGPGP